MLSRLLTRIVRWWRLRKIRRLRGATITLPPASSHKGRIVKIVNTTPSIGSPSDDDHQITIELSPEDRLLHPELLPLMPLAPHDEIVCVNDNAELAKRINAGTWKEGDEVPTKWIVKNEKRAEVVDKDGCQCGTKVLIVEENEEEEDSDSFLYDDDEEEEDGKQP